MTEQELPPLTGSPRQVAWAEDLRARAIQDLRVFRETKPGLGRGLALMLYHRDGPDAVDAAILAQTDARWWIDGRKAEHYVHRVILAALEA